MPSSYNLIDDLSANSSLNRTCGTRFPAELADITIDFLHADRVSLAACSLTCRGWLPAARFHLFYHIDVTVHTWRQLDYLLYSSPPIAALVQNLSLAVEDPIVGEEQHDWPRTELLAQFHMEFCGLLSYMSSVRAIRIHGKWGMPDTAHFFLAALRTLPKVAEVDISELRVARFSTFVEFLARFPLLRRFSVSSVEWEANDTPSTALRIPHRATAALRITARPKYWARNLDAGAQSQHFIAWLARQPRPPEVHSLLLHVEHDGGRLARDLLQSALAPSIRLLYLRCGRLCDGADALIEGIGRCARLQDLHFGPLAVEFFDARADVLARVLAGITSAHLQRVSIALTLPLTLPAAVGGDTLRAMDHALGSHVEVEVILLVDRIELEGKWDAHALHVQWAALGVRVPLSVRVALAMEYDAEYGAPRMATH
ncbi:hypothetical protein HWV62_8785 [Athelia sp. TMB]|nr:hypothetical protein HWV62_8785 [Athelia sp. TMB]